MLVRDAVGSEPVSGASIRFSDVCGIERQPAELAAVEFKQKKQQFELYAVPLSSWRKNLARTGEQPQTIREALAQNKPTIPRT
jgi:hypothetical protein